MLKLFHRISSEVVSISIDENNINCTWFKNDKKSKKIILKDHQTFYIENFEIHNLNIFNHKLLFNHISLFLDKNKLNNSFIYLSLSGNQVQDRIIQLESKDKLSPIIDKQETNLAISYYCIDKTNFYIAKIPHSLIFQYKAFSIGSRINLSKITTENAAIINVLQNYSENKSFNDILELNDYFYKFCKFYDISKNIVITNDNLNLEAEKYSILKNLGLFLLNNYE